MKRNMLGNTGIEVSELCLGTLPMGPLQKDLPVDEAGDLIAAALEGGINFLDTAQMYNTYPHIRAGLERTKLRPVIASKSFAKSYNEMEDAVGEALEGMGVPWIDIFHLHAARVDTTVFKERKQAHRCLLDYKEKGVIKAVGISTHAVPVVRLAADRDDIDVVYPLLNLPGSGLLQGTREEMEQAIGYCAAAGKGLYLMKVLGGGNLLGDYFSAIHYARSITGPASISLGMVSHRELEYNLEYFNSNGGADLPAPTAADFHKAYSIVRVLCQDCGACIEACPNNAISSREGTAHIDHKRCLTCGYCVGACSAFAIRLV